MRTVNGDEVSCLLSLFVSLEVMMATRILLLGVAAALLADAAANVEDPEYDREKFPETFEPKEASEP